VVGEAAPEEGSRKITTIGPDVTVGKNAKVGPGAMVEEAVKEGEAVC
jgi:UDP-3-O-[3-hydroxymyristoyl] glucosamine N-acyltransferase